MSDNLPNADPQPIPDGGSADTDAAILAAPKAAKKGNVMVKGLVGGNGVSLGRGDGSRLRKGEFAEVSQAVAAVLVANGQAEAE